MIRRIAMVLVVLAIIGIIALVPVLGVDGGGGHMAGLPGAFAMMGMMALALLAAIAGAFVLLTKPREDARNRDALRREAQERRTVVSLADSPNEQNLARLQTMLADFDTQGHNKQLALLDAVKTLSPAQAARFEDELWALVQGEEDRTLAYHGARDILYDRLAHIGVEHLEPTIRTLSNSPDPIHRRRAIHLCHALIDGVVDKPALALEVLTVLAQDANEALAFRAASSLETAGGRAHYTASRAHSVPRAQ